VDFAENVSRGHDAWREPYLAQGEHKRQQIERMIRYAESHQCRMVSVVRHFGDFADGEKPCGICDSCAPTDCQAQRFRSATPAEHEAALRVAADLRSAGGKSTGKLYARLFPYQEMSRADFENLLGGMARAGILRLDDAVFEKDGRQVPYRTARLTPAGQEVDARNPLELVMKDREPPATRRKRRKKAAFDGALPPRAGMGAGGGGAEPIAVRAPKSSRPKPPRPGSSVAVDSDWYKSTLAKIARTGYK